MLTFAQELVLVYVREPVPVRALVEMLPEVDVEAVLKQLTRQGLVVIKLDEQTALFGPPEQLACRAQGVRFKSLAELTAEAGKSCHRTAPRGGDA